MTLMTTIRAAVAIVLDVEQIAINVGSNGGVVKGDQVQLLREVDIPDPTQEGLSLGKAFVVKGQLKIESVEEKFSIARVVTVRNPSNLFMPTYERQFSIVDSRQKEGEGRVYVQQNDPVDVFIPHKDEEEAE